MRPPTRNLLSTLFSAVPMALTVAPTDEIIDSCSRCKQGPQEGPQSCACGVSLGISLLTQETYTRGHGHVQCSALFKSARQRRNRPYEGIGFHIRGQGKRAEWLTLAPKSEESRM